MEGQLHYSSEAGKYTGYLKKPEDLKKAFLVLIQLEEQRLAMIKRELSEIKDVKKIVEDDKEK